jgi:hypothetical protein
VGPGRYRLRTRPSTRASANGEDHRPDRAAGYASNSPPACGPAGYLNGMRPGSELGRQVAVDFESDADLHECGSCPVHSRLPTFHNDHEPKLGHV